MGYTHLEDAQIKGLTHARATSAERAVYEALSRVHDLREYPGNPSWCFRPVGEIAKITDYNRDTVAKALRSLCEKEFVGGVPVLERIGGGHRGQATVYADNLWAWSEWIKGRELTLPSSCEALKGGSQSPTNQMAKGGSLSPTKEEDEKVGQSVTKGGSISGKVGQSTPKGGSQSPTHNKYPEQVPTLSNSERAVSERETAKVDLLVSSDGDHQRNVDDDLEAFEREFKSWLWSNTGPSGQKPGQVHAWFRRLGEKRKAGLNATFAELDRIANVFPACDDDLEDNDLEVVNAARSNWANNYVSVYYAWLVLTWNGWRTGSWLTV